MTQSWSLYVKVPNIWLPDLEHVGQFVSLLSVFLTFSGCTISNDCNHFGKNRALSRTSDLSHESGRWTDEMKSLLVYVSLGPNEFQKQVLETDTAHQFSKEK